MTVDLPAHGVGSAGRGHAGDMGPLRGCHHLRVLHTVDEGVAGVADRAAADRVVVHNLEYLYSYSLIKRYIAVFTMIIIAPYLKQHET